MANLQFTGNRSSFSRGLCCCGECSVSSYSCLSYSPPLVLVLAQGDGVGGQQGVTHQAVLQAPETLKSFQDLQLRPDHCVGVVL